MAYPTILGVSHTHVNANATSTVVVIPDGSNVTGYLVIVIAVKDGTGVFTWPAGWTVLEAANDGAGSSRTEVRYRIVDGTEGWDGTGDTITLTHASERTAVSTITYSTWHGTTAPESEVASSVTNGNADPPALSPSWGSSETSWVAACGIDGLITISAFPTDYTGNQHADNNGSTLGVAHGFATRQLTASSDDPSAFTNGSSPWVAVTIAVRPGVLTGAVGQASETDTANAVTVVLWRLVGQASETDAAQEIEPTLSSTIMVGRASETDTAQAITAVHVIAVGQASETDAAQAITALLIHGVAQASEIDTAGTITPYLVPPIIEAAVETNRAHQVSLSGGTLPPSGAPVLIRAPGKAGRIFHEISRGGDSFHPSIGEWESVEDAPGGFRSAKGLISSCSFLLHREVMREGALWRTFTEDGKCIFAGRLKEPDPDGSVIQLAANGRAHIADREVGPILYQVAVGSDLAFFSGKSKKWTAEFTTLSHNLTDTGLVFTRDDTGSATPDNGVSAVIPFFGRDLGYMRFHVEGRRALLSVKSTVRTRQPNILSSAELDVSAPQENWFFHFQESALGTGQAAVDLTLGSNDLPNPNSTIFTNDGVPANTGIGYVWPDCIIVSCGDNSATTMSNGTEVLLANIEVNGAALGSSRSYSVGDLVEDIAARLGFQDVRAGGSYDITPYELPPGVPASEALDWACLITGKRYRILDSGARATFEFGPWRDHVWGLASPWSPLRTLPMERFDAVVMPFSYPGTHGQLTDTVIARVEDSPLPRKNIYRELALADPAHNRDKAQDLGAEIADTLVRHRFAGDFQAAEVIGPDGERRSAHHVNAGDVLEPWRGDEPGRLRIGALTRFEDHVEGEFDGGTRALDRLLARREKRLSRR